MLYFEVFCFLVVVITVSCIALYKYGFGMNAAGRATGCMCVCVLFFNIFRLKVNKWPLRFQWVIQVEALCPILFSSLGSFSKYIH